MFVAFAVLSVLALAQAQPNLCADPRNCRQVGTVEIRVEDRTLQAPINSEIPFVAGNGLTLFAGESVVAIVSEDGTLTVESHGQASDVIDLRGAVARSAEVEAAGQAAIDGAVPSMRRLAGTEPPADRVRLSLMQVPGEVDTLLLVENRTARRLDYAAEMQVPGGRGPQQTTVCALIPGIESMEHWPHPIAVITVTDFRAVPNEGAPVCD